MSVIHKEHLTSGFHRVHGRPVSVGLDGTGTPAVWFVVGEPYHHVQTVPTGVDFEPSGTFLGTFVTPEGLVFHAFSEAS